MPTAEYTIAHDTAVAPARSGWLDFTPSALDPNTSAHLDMIRSLAACAVMWGQVRKMFFVDYPQLQSPTPFHRFLDTVTGLGHQSVMIFFVLSGFFISSAVLKRHAKGDWSWGDSLTDR